MGVTGAARGIGELAAGLGAALPKRGPGVGGSCLGWFSRWEGGKIGPKGPGMGRMMFGDGAVGAEPTNFGGYSVHPAGVVFLVDGSWFSGANSRAESLGSIFWVISQHLFLPLHIFPSSQIPKHSMAPGRVVCPPQKPGCPLGGAGPWGGAGLSRSWSSRQVFPASPPPLVTPRKGSRTQRKAASNTASCEPCLTRASLGAAGRR